MFEVNFDKKTEYLMSVAASIDNYCQYLKKDLNDYSTILGYVYRVHQKKIIKLPPQALALIIIYLKDVKEEEYEKYIDAFKDKVEDILNNSKNLKEQFQKMDEIKKNTK